MPPAPKLTDEVSVPVNVNVLDTDKVFPLEIVNVALDAGCVIVNLLIVVAVALPSVGDVKVGDDASTTAPEPVTADIWVPLIFNTLPVPAVSNVLFVRISVVSPVINVPVVAGSVNVPDAVALACNCVFPDDEPLNWA